MEIFKTKDGSIKTAASQVIKNIDNNLELKRYFYDQLKDCDAVKHGMKIPKFDDVSAENIIDILRQRWNYGESKLEDGEFATAIPDGAKAADYKIDTTKSSWNYIIMNSCFYVFWAVVIIAICWVLYKWLFKKVDKKKKQQVAQEHNIDISKVTLDMLCEYSESNNIYYYQLEILDESKLGDWIKSILPTPKNIIRWMDGGIKMLNGLSATTEEGLKDGSVNAILGTFTNILTGIGNLVLITAKSLLLGITALFR